MERVTSAQWRRSPWLSLLTAFHALCLVHAQMNGGCKAPDHALQEFIDPDTPTKYCTKKLCIDAYEKCCGSESFSCDSETYAEAPQKELRLVFSDEFNNNNRKFDTPASDLRWVAADMHYSSDLAEEQNYKPDKVKLEDGAVIFEMEDKASDAILHAVDGDRIVTKNFTSGMLHGWNKFCFTGGYAEFAVKLPGDDKTSGFWAATWLMGNLGRIGHYKSTYEMWPFSYDSCEGSKKEWWTQYPMRISKCNEKRGRGAPEIDVLEYGIFQDWRNKNDSATPQYVHTLQMGPVAPPNTSWRSMDGLKPSRGVHQPGTAYRDSFGTFLGEANSPLNTKTHIRSGTRLSDQFVGHSKLIEGDYFSKYHVYAAYWEPGEFIRWYVDDILLFEVNKEALRAQVSRNGRIEQRLIPLEPMYMILNLAQSNASWSRVQSGLEYPAYMSIDYVRVYQWPDAPNQHVGCDPPGFETTQYISCNRDLYLGAGERSSWRLPMCTDINYPENKFLLGLAVTSVALGTACLALMLCMKPLLNSSSQACQGPHAVKASSNLFEREAGCYIRRGPKHIKELLKHTRPDLIAVAQHAGKHQ